MNECKSKELIVVSAFDGVHHSYLELSTAVLRMLHVEIRGHVYYYVNKSFSRTFHLEQEIHEPDPDIVALNSDLVRFDEELSTHLNQTQQS
jgi:exocyst complex component 4